MGSSGPRFFISQNIGPAGDVGDTGSLTTDSLEGDDTEELRMPGGANFETETVSSPCRPPASKKRWTPPSPPPSPPRRIGDSRSAPLSQEDQPAGAVDEVPQALESGGWLGYVIRICAEFIGIL